MLGIFDYSKLVKIADTAKTLHFRIAPASSRWKTLLLADHGLAATYLQNADLRYLRQPRTDATVNFNWATAPQRRDRPVPLRPLDRPDSAPRPSVTFYTYSDDGVPSGSMKQIINN